jgi:hypothetical protein
MILLVSLVSKLVSLSYAVIWDITIDGYKSLTGTTDCRNYTEI